MNLTKLIEERNKVFDKKHFELLRESHWGDSEDSPVYDFGYKTKRGIELFTVTDFGNIRRFHTDSIRLAYEQGRKDAVEEVRGVIEEFPSATRSDFNYEKVICAYDIQSKLTEMLGDKK